MPSLASGTKFAFPTILLLSNPSFVVARLTCKPRAYFEILGGGLLFLNIGQGSDLYDDDAVDSLRLDDYNWDNANGLLLLAYQYIILADRKIPLTQRDESA